MSMKREEPELHTWETVHYTDNPELPELDEMVDISHDFLPSLDKLVFKKPTRKVTIVLEEESIDFFKAEAKRRNVPYQRMIRALLQAYVERAK